MSGETYPNKERRSKEGTYEVSDLSLTPYLVPQECGMRMDTEWLEVTRHTGLDNSRPDSSNQTLRIEKTDRKFAFSCLPYTASEIENALHHEELPQARRTVLCVYGQKVHQIRLAKSYFDDVANGIKTFELRKNDRGYKKGDILEMMEFADGKNTGRMVRVLVTYILEDYTGIEDGYCIMATKLMKDGEEHEL